MPDRPIFSDARAVLFDASGTLVVSHPTFEEALAMALRALGVRKPVEGASTLCATINVVYRTCVMRYRFSVEERRAKWQEIFRVICDAGCYWGLATETASPAQRIEAELARIHSTLRAATGASDVLAAIRRSGRRIGVVSNFDAQLPAVLAEVGLREHVDAVIASAVVGCEKPDAGIFEAALKQLGVSAIQAVHVGDDAFDVIGAAAAGIPSIWLSASGEAYNGPPGSSASPSAVIRTLPEVLPLLGIVTE